MTELIATLSAVATIAPEARKAIEALLNVFREMTPEQRAKIDADYQYAKDLRKRFFPVDGE